ncbi:hypothetical protein Q5P01_007508 [Channa striata]|uniref:Podoplanin n=1 Tax=Channa striata TaxID=64152 RepID=A0AA88SYP6_CHASR|nr:hypothetical protein Q5P01_007508 [Channa striata]
MNVQLLLLLALVGPFCAFTHASPTMHPTGTTTDEPTTQEVQSVTDAFFSFGPSTKNPHEPTTTYEVTAVFKGDHTVLTTDPPLTLATTIEPEFLITTSAVVDIVFTEPEKSDVSSTASGTEKDPEVVVEDKIVEGLSAGQVVGIVIGALLAVVVLIAVIIAVVRRMGNYSP